jgi:hypothetical protein
LGAGTRVCFWCKISPKCEISFWGLRRAFFFFGVRNFAKIWNKLWDCDLYNGYFWKFLEKIAKKVRVLDWIRQI